MKAPDLLREQDYPLEGDPRNPITPDDPAHSMHDIWMAQFESNIPQPVFNVCPLDEIPF